MDPKKILGVSSDATQEEIQKAFRAKAKKHHPDLGGDSWAFQQVQDAYHALTNHDIEPLGEIKKSSDPSSSPSPRPAAFVRPSELSTEKPVNPSKPAKKANLFTSELPLQNETTFFILINCLDIFLTFILLRFGAMEANPIANYFFQQWGFNGMIGFKLVIVAVVCVIAQVVAREKVNSARGLLIVGSALVAMVNIYSLTLFAKNFH